MMFIAWRCLCNAIWASFWENRIFAYAKPKPQISCAVTTQLISAFVFATWIVQSLYFLNPKFRASSHLLWLHSLVCVGHGRKHRTPVFSERGSFVLNDVIQYFLAYFRITVMAFATFLLFVVLPGMTFSLDTFSSFVDFHNNVCPYKDESCKDIFEEVGLESPCCSFCDCDLVTCKEYAVWVYIIALRRHMRAFHRLCE